ncbi:MAG: paraquat-inducible protein A [Rhodocyclaceae bacterium]|nr:paraquat-inducible protein A [Rhodocyclaceae bacterium]MBX3670516.1 paraquat-inducible protein A [Rhodocyclaceae bacterium]
MSEAPAFVTAARLGLASCPDCALVQRLGADGRGRCPRCHAFVTLRKPNSLPRTWAFLLAATVLYPIANLLPIMRSGNLFNAQDDTILSGIAYLWVSGSWPLALVVFVASVLVPLLKIIALSWLALSVQRHARRHRRQRTHLYRLVELVGRWSMLDIFVVTLLSALVQLNSLAEVSAGPGALAFAGVVVFTMLASHSFDPRLIWDGAGRDD